MCLSDWHNQNLIDSCEVELRGCKIGNFGCILALLHCFVYRNLKDQAFHIKTSI